MLTGPCESSRLCDRPLAVAGLKSYRCRGRYGFIMIGAADDADALREARRSWPEATADRIEVWDGAQYAPLGKK